jgi:hypothetical protein
MNKVIARKEQRGWVARSKVALTDKMVLELITMKRSGGQLATTATVGRVENGFVSHIVYQDFSKVVATSSPGRITQSTVETQHNAVDVDAVVQQARTFYKMDEVTV